jgi:hypothetical protein
MRMDVDDLDAAILSHARERWEKVAKIAGCAMQDRGLGLSDDQLDIVVARVRSLVERGLLVAQGNPSRPRFSEVRRPGGVDVDRTPRQDLRP